MGVPVAFTPGLVPHCDVLTVVAPGLVEEAALDDDGAPADELLLPHAASASRPITAMTANGVRISARRLENPTCPTSWCRRCKPARMSKVSRY
jgi:hypothetical protein